MNVYDFDNTKMCIRDSIYSLRAYEPKFVYAAGKAEKELRGVKRYVNLFYRIYNGRRRHEILPMKF